MRHVQDLPGNPYGWIPKCPILKQKRKDTECGNFVTRTDLGFPVPSQRHDKNTFSGLCPEIWRKQRFPKEKNKELILEGLSPGLPDLFWSGKRTAYSGNTAELSQRLTVMPIPWKNRIPPTTEVVGFLREVILMKRKGARTRIFRELALFSSKISLIPKNY